MRRQEDAMKCPYCDREMQREEPGHKTCRTSWCNMWRHYNYAGFSLIQTGDGEIELWGWLFCSRKEPA